MDTIRNVPASDQFSQSVRTGWYRYHQLWQPRPQPVESRHLCPPCYVTELSLPLTWASTLCSLSTQQRPPTPLPAALLSLLLLWPNAFRSWTRSSFFRLFQDWSFLLPHCPHCYTACGSRGLQTQARIRRELRSFQFKQQVVSDHWWSYPGGFTTDGLINQPP